MTYPTHKQFSYTFVYISSMLMLMYSISNVNYYLALLIMMQIGKYGALFPDIDHHWGNVKEKNIPNWIINKIIHMTGGSHRSWQTHSIDITLGFTLVSFFLPEYLEQTGKMTTINSEVLGIIMLGFSAGWISHIFSDMLSSAGVRVFFWSNKTFAFVPKKLFNFRFNTGNAWESFVYSVIRKLNVIFGLIAIVFPWIYYNNLLSI